MSAILDVGQPYTAASIELCNIFNAALNQIDYKTSLKLIPNEDSHETKGWLLSEAIGEAGEVVYTDQGVIKLNFFKVSPWPVTLESWYNTTINLSEPDSLEKLGQCLKRFAIGK